MAYTIKEIARLANVSTRTIRYYGELGLLPPASIGENGYRYYSRQSLLTLQQILFFRELEVPLKEISRVMTNPDFNPLETLTRHREALEKRTVRTTRLITTIDNTIRMFQGDTPMAEQELFNGFDEEKYADEAKTRWGATDSYKISQKRWASYSDAQKEKIKAQGKAITARMVGEDGSLPPDDPGVQEAIADYLAYLNEYFYPCDVQFLRGLAAMWVEDPRFAVNYERIREGGAQFVKDAVDIFCDNH